MRVTHVAVILACSLLALLLSVAPAAADKRVALVIGNGAYQKVTKLPNPTKDARAIAALLQSAGFDAVEVHENLGIRELRQAIKDFSGLAQDADVAIVYYSGHGMEVNGTNYLIPIDATLDQDIDVPYEAYSLDNLVQTLEPARRLRLVMLDACRDNPFARSMKRTIGTRAVSRGLAAVEPASVNTLIGYAAKAGSTALDGEGANSPYATALLHNLAIPGLDLRIAFGRVRDEVLNITHNKQEPFVYGSLGGANVSIVDAQHSSPNTAAPLASTAPIDPAAQAWAATKDTTSIAILEDFVRHFGSTVFGSMARARITELKKAQLAAINPKPLSSPPPAPSAPAIQTERDPLCAKAIGTWAWVFGSGDVVVRPNGSFVHTDGSPGTWTCSEGRLVLKFGRGEERMTVAKDGNTMSGVSWFTHYTIPFSVQRKH